jgi:hypothetical protein
MDFIFLPRKNPGGDFWKKVAVITPHIMKPYKGVYLSKYAILISEDNLDLIEKLNDGVRPKMEEKTHCTITDRARKRDQVRATSIQMVTRSPSSIILMNRVYKESP